MCVKLKHSSRDLKIIGVYQIICGLNVFVGALSISDFSGFDLTSFIPAFWIGLSVYALLSGSLILTGVFLVLREPAAVFATLLLQTIQIISVTHLGKGYGIDTSFLNWIFVAEIEPGILYVTIHLVPVILPIYLLQLLVRSKISFSKVKGLLSVKRHALN